MVKLLLTTITIIGFGVTSSAEIYKIDPAMSKVEWIGSKKIGKSHNGEIKVKSGEVQTDEKGKIKSITAVVDMKTISNIDLKDDATYQKKLVDHLSNDDFFKTEKFPESTFKLTSINPKEGSKDEYLIKGELTIVGKTEAIEFPAKITTDKSTISGTAKLSIDRLKWGIQYGSGNIFKTLTADKIINDTFDLTLNLTAKK